MKTIIKISLLLAIFLMTACASKRIIMKKCEKAGNDFFICEEP